MQYRTTVEVRHGPRSQVLRVRQPRGARGGRGAHARTGRGRGAGRGVRGRAEPGRERRSARRSPRAVAGRAARRRRAATSPDSWSRPARASTRFSRGDEVMGFVDHGAQATHVVVPEANLMPRPPALSWEVAGSLYTAGTTAWTAVEGLGLGPGDTVVVTAAAGGVGCLAAQFARMRGATVVGTSVETRFDFLRQFGVIPTAYGPGLAERVRALAPSPVTAFLDFLGGEALEAKALGVPASRVLTVLDWDAVDEHGAVRAVGRRRRRARTGRRARGGTTHPPADRRRVPARRRGRRVSGARQARGARQDRARPPRRRLSRVSACASPRSRSRT